MGGPYCTRKKTLFLRSRRLAPSIKFVLGRDSLCISKMGLMSWPQISSSRTCRFPFPFRFSNRSEWQKVGAIFFFGFGVLGIAKAGGLTPLACDHKKLGPLISWVLLFPIQIVVVMSCWARNCFFYTATHAPLA